MMPTDDWDAYGTVEDEPDDPDEWRDYAEE